MTGRQRQSSAPLGPPWSVDLLADLHAGALDPAVAAHLRATTAADPAVQAVMAALDATQAELAELPELHPVPMPADVAARIDAALAAEARAVTPHSSPGPPAVASLDDARRRRRIGWGAGLLGAAAVAVAVAVVALPRGGDPAGTPPPVAAPRETAPEPGTSPPGTPPLALSGSDLGGSVSQVLGTSDYGPLGGLDQFRACLAASGVGSAGSPLGVRPVRLDGRPRVLAILPAGKLGSYRLLVLTPTCGQGSPGVLSDTVIGAR